MLKLVLREIESAEAVTLRDLERRLGVDCSALEGMLELLISKGRVKKSGRSEAGAVPACGGWGAECSGIDGCPFVAKIPCVYTLASAVRRRSER